MKISWRELELFDSDGCSPDEHDRRRLLRGYRDLGEIPDYYLVDPSGAGSDSDYVWDKFNNCWREAYDAGPDQDQVDWTGLD